MKIAAMVVTKNEADRYLGAFLEWTQTFVDEVVVYDDLSEDATVQIAMGKGCVTGVRFPDEPSFVEHEGKFRQAAWNWMSSTLDLTTDDWVVCLDADEFLVDDMGERRALETVAESVYQLGGNAAVFEIPEIWSQTGTRLYRRVDGWWGRIDGLRFVRWQPGGVFSDRPMACGSVPTYARPVSGPGPSILHFGYLDYADKVAKYERYKSLSGHSNAHVESILQPGMLEVWEGPLPFRT